MKKGVIPSIEEVTQKNPLLRTYIWASSNILRSSPSKANQKKKKPPMNTIFGSSTKPSYDDFEPTFVWEKDVGHDNLYIDVPDFKKEQLRVKFNSGVLNVSGERPTTDNKTKRFQKQITISKDCKPEDIHANIVGGNRLRISVPSSTQELQQSRNDRFKFRIIIKSFASSLNKINKNAVAKVGGAVVVAGLGVYGAYMTYKYRSCR